MHAYEDGRRWYGRALARWAKGVLDEVARLRLMTGYAGAQCLSSTSTARSRPASRSRPAVRIAVRMAGEAALVPEPTFDDGSTA